MTSVRSFLWSPSFIDFFNLCIFRCGHAATVFEECVLCCCPAMDGPLCASACLASACLCMWPVRRLEADPVLRSIGGGGWRLLRPVRVARGWPRSSLDAGDRPDWWQRLIPSVRCGYPRILYTNHASSIVNSSYDCNCSLFSCLDLSNYFALCWLFDKFVHWLICPFRISLYQFWFHSIESALFLSIFCEVGSLLNFWNVLMGR